MATTIKGSFTAGFQRIGIVKDQLYIPPFPASIPELIPRICAAINFIDGNMLANLWDICRVTKGSIIEFHENYSIMQLTKTDWDSPIPQQLTEDWLKFQKAFNAINYLTAPRWVILTTDNTVELHGFADASSLAYAAAICCRQNKGSTTCIKNLSSSCQTSFHSSIGVVRYTFTIQVI
ncbi:hypothetical protein TNCV_4120021 [Trichonephila clavipes]|nr:hypothetical protein TNCV_4120021 [Trichonephila clavipes]